eukprot:Skav205703  [mRNA]  locus=scaffold4631:39740:44161:- [translate_table: standard]
MIEIVDVDFSQDDVILQCRHYAAEGFGAGHFDHQPLFIPTDTYFQDEKILWEVNRPLPPKRTKLWMWGLQDRDDLRGQMQMCLAFTDGSDWGIVPQTSSQRPLRVVEMFAGGFGGWHGALQFIGENAAFDHQTVAIDYDADAIKSFAITHHTMFIPPTTCIDHNHDWGNDNWAWQADITDPLILPGLCNFAPDVVSISSPCPPWSSANRAEGLGCPDGQLLARSLLLCKWLRPTQIWREQVLGFNSHKHKPWIIKLISWLGYRVQWQKVLNLSDHANCQRVRWLALLVRINADQTPRWFCSWPQGLKTPDEPVQLPAERMRHLVITDEMLAVAKNPAYSVMKDQSPLVVFQSRVYDDSQIKPTFMALYGSQHRLSPATLSSKGYLGHFKKDDTFPNGARLWHVVEEALIHGVHDRVFLVNDHETGYRIIGNQISLPHALVVEVNGLQAFGIDVDMNAIFACYHDKRLKGASVHLQDTAHGSMVMHSNQMLVADFRAHIDALWTPDPPLCFWSPHQGWTDAPTDAMDDLPAQPPRSPEPTAVMGLMQASVGFDPPQTIWVDPDLSQPALTFLWENTMMPHVVENQPCTLHFRLCAHDMGHLDSPEDFALLLVDDQLHVIACQDKPLVAHSRIMDKVTTLFDQYGQVPVYQMPNNIAVLLPHLLQHHLLCPEVSVQDLVRNTDNLEWDWHPASDSIRCTIKNTQDTAAAIASVLRHAMFSDSFQHLGRTIQVTTTDDGFTQTRWDPCRTTGVCPPGPFRLALSIALSRGILDTMQVPSDATGCRVRIMHLGRVLWEGSLPWECTTLKVLEVFRFAFASIYEGTAFRLMKDQSLLAPVDTLRDHLFALQIFSNKPTVLHLEHGPTTLRLTGGGGKTQIRDAQMSALATTLLEQGFALSWTSQTVETLAQKHSLQTLQNATQLKGAERAQATLKLVKDAGVQIPKMERPQTRQQQPGTPWAKYQRTRADGAPLLPSDYTMIEGFFKNEDGSPSAILTMIRPQGTGICMMSPSQAASWLKEDQKLSSDELAILVLGSPVGLGKNGEKVTFPCRNSNGDMVLLTAMMYQLGMKTIAYQKGDPRQIDTKKCHLLALTLYKSDFSEKEWAEATTSTMAFIRSLMLEAGHMEGLHAMWGRSLRNGKQPASPQQAKTVQVHLTYQADSLDQFLSRSGFNRMYLVPKLESGRPDLSYRILWCPGDFTTMSGHAANTPGCRGLVRGKNVDNYGLRYKQDDYAQAWTHVFPGTAPPDQQTGDLMYKISGLPFGCTKDVVEKWTKELKWKAYPLRTLGPQTWLMRASELAPVEMAHFNALPVLIRHLPPRQLHGQPQIVGPRSSTTLQNNGTDPWQQNNGLDPWQQPGRPVMPPNAAPRSVEGPTEQRLSAQDKKLELMRQDLDRLATTQQQQAEEVAAKFGEAEKREELNQAAMQTHMSNMQRTLEQGFVHAMQQQSRAIEGQFAELKQLFSAAKKRDAPDGEMES